MRGSIGKLLGVAVALVVFAFASFYVGSRAAAAAAESIPAANDLSRQFAADPGDGWMLFGGFLMLVALALAFAGAMLWMQERKVES